MSEPLASDTESMAKDWRPVSEAFKAESPATTIVLAREFLAKHPDCGPAWKVLGATLIELGQYREGEEALRRAIAICPLEKLWIPIADMGHMYKSCGDFRAAAAWYRKAIAAEPNNASPHIYLGDLLFKSGRLQEAEAAHRTATLCGEGYREDAYLNLGLVLRALERLDEAAEAFQKAIDLDPDCWTARRALGDVTLAMGIMTTSAQESE